MTAPTNNTPFLIMQDSYLDAGLIQRGETLNGEQLTSGLRKLNDLINFYQTRGCKLWLDVDTPVPLTASTGSYTLTPSGSVNMTKPLRVEEAYYLDASSNSRPITVISWREWLLLPNRTSAGALNSVFVDKQATSLIVHTWLVPDTTSALGVLHLLLRTQVTNPINLIETMAFPQEWRIALRWGLADEICTGQSQAIMDRCASRAAMYLEQLEDWDVEDTDTRFAPDSRISPHSSFR